MFLSNECDALVYAIVLTQLTSRTHTTTENDEKRGSIGLAADAEGDTLKFALGGGSGAKTTTDEDEIEDNSCAGAPEAVTSIMTPTCTSYEEGDTCMSYEQEDTCMSYEQEDTCWWKRLLTLVVNKQSFFFFFPM